jgi:hypothetical protein
VPGPADFAFGDALNDVWYDFFVNGTSTRLAEVRCSDRARPDSEPAQISTAPGYPAHWTVNLINSEGTVAVSDLRAERCAMFTSLGFGRPEWWCD